MSSNTWKLQDAKARFSELVRLARKGHPQRVTVHGKDAVVVVDPERFEIRPKGAVPMTMAEFLERSKAYRAKDASEEVEFDRRIEMNFRPSPFEPPEDQS
jgi:antitoxin Phd